MKPIPQTVAEIKQARGFVVSCALHVEFSSGEYAYTSSDWNPQIPGTTLRQRVVNWGGCNALYQIRDPKSFPQAAFSVTIGDPDGELRDKFEDELFQNRPCKLYWAVWTPGEVEPTYSEAVHVLSGTLVPPVEWREGTREIGLEITDLAARDETLVGVRCTREDFPQIGEEHEGRIVPLVYGYADRVEPVLLNFGVKSKLVKWISDTVVGPGTIYVADGRRFPQGVFRHYTVGREIILITFDGNVGNIGAEARGSRDIFDDTTSAISAGSCTLIDNTLGGLGDAKYPDNCFVGFELKVTPDGDISGNFIQTYDYNVRVRVSFPAYTAIWGEEESRRIIRMVKSQDQIEWMAPFVVEKSVLDDGGRDWVVDGSQLRIGAGVDYVVGTNAQPHISGEDVVLWHPTMAVTRYEDDADANWPWREYALAMGHCTVRQVYVHGRTKTPRTLYIGGIRGYFGSFTLLGNMMQREMERRYKATQRKDDWVPLREDLWTVDYITVRGQTVTRLRLVNPPTWLADYDCTRDEIRVDVVGPLGAGAEPMRNPADVIEEVYSEYGDVGYKRIDNDLVGWWKMDDGSGATATDYSGNGEDGTLQGNAFFVDDGQILGAIDLPGAIGDRVMVPNSPNLQTGCAGEFSVAFRFRLDDLLADGQYVMDKMDAGALNGWIIVFNPVTSTIEFTEGGPNPTLRAYTFDDEWHHCAIVYSNAGPTVDFYIDGVHLGQRAGIGIGTAGNAENLYIGTDFAIAPINGRLDDVRIYGSVITAAEVAHLAELPTTMIDVSDARSNLTNWQMNFIRYAITPLRELVADLAHQARCRIRWLRDDPELLYIGADGGDVDLLVAPEHMLLGSAATTRDEIEASATRVITSWTEDGKERSHVERDEAAEAELGQRERTIACWAYDEPSAPIRLARFYLAAWSKLHDVAALAATVHGVGLEPADIIGIEPTYLGPFRIAEFDANLLEYAGDFADVPGTWVITRLVDVVAYATDPPVDISRADKLVESWGDGVWQHYVQQGGLPADGRSSYIFAVRAKAAERSQVVLWLSSAGFPGLPTAGFDLTDHSTFLVAAVDDYGIKDLGDDWHLCWIRATSDTVSAAQQAFVSIAAGDTTFYVGNEMSGLYVSGAQYHTGLQLDEYMPTWNRDGTRTNVSLRSGALTHGAHARGKLAVGDDRDIYTITDNGRTWVRVAGDVEGDGYAVDDDIRVVDLADYDAFSAAPTKARVMSVTHEIGREGVMTAEALRAKMFRWPGCNSRCEGSCETTACESECESYWEPEPCAYTCETTCQAQCEMTCETGGELFCSDHACETGLVVGCYISCQVAQMMGGGGICGSCETLCQSDCQAGGCQTLGYE